MKSVYVQPTLSKHINFTKNNVMSQLQCKKGNAENK